MSSLAVPRPFRRARPSERRRPGRTAWVLAAVVLQLLAVVGVLATTSSPADAGPAPVMLGYVPLRADDMRAAMAGIAAGAGTTLDFTVGITNAASGSVMYYDQWEDGFEANLSTPSQASTLVFGDANVANGNAATYCSACAGDLLPQGASLTMRNNVATPRAPATVLFDGGDKIGSTRGFAITAGGFTTSLGSLLAGVVASYDVSKYGTDFTMPVGQDTPVPAGTSNAFGYTGVIVQAAQNGTVVDVDTDGNGTVDVTRTINEGASFLVNGGVNDGATVHSSKPVEVQLVTGDLSASYESRWYTLFPDSRMSNDYMSMAGSNVTNFRTINYLFNPSAASITVTPTCTGCSGTITVPAKANASFASPLGQAVRFTSPSSFIAVAGVGSQSGAAPGGGTDQSSAWDWGFTMIPSSQLTTQVVLGWSPGNSNNPPSSPAGNRNDDPVWVTTLSATTIYVDYDGNPATGAIASADCFGARHDTDIPVAALASTRIFDNTDGDMTGARVYTCDGTKVAGAWGQDAANAPSGSPGFDAGYTIIPTTTMLVDKTAALTTDANGDGAFGPGDVVTYDIQIADAGSLAFSSVVAKDVLPPGVTYVPGSTVYDDGASPISIADDVAPPATTVFPLDDAGASLPNINAGATVHLRFRASIDNPFTAGGTTLTNSSCVTAAEASDCDVVVTPLAASDLSLTKTEIASPTYIGDTARFRVVVSNAGPDTATGVQVTDLLPTGTTYLSATTSQGTYNDTTGRWAVGTLANGASATLQIDARITVASVRNYAEVTASGAADPDSQPAEGPLGAANPPNQDDEAAVTVSVTLPLPVASPDSGTTAFNTPLVVPAPGVLGNDTGSSLTVTSHTNPTHGTVSINPDGSYTYTPTSGYFGPDAFTYTVTDSLGRTATATVTLTVQTPTPPNAVDDSYSAAYQTPVTVAAPGTLANDTGTSVTVTGHTNPTHGTVTINANGSLTYTPAAGYAGPDSFTYTITDVAGQTDTATVSLTVSPPAGPLAVNDTGSTPYLTPLVVSAPGVLGNDSGTGISVTGHTDPSHGTVTINANGSYTYTPVAGYAGSDSFTYTITDGFSRTSTATVNLTVAPPPAPVANPDSYTTPFETVLTVTAPGTKSNDTGTVTTVTGHTDPAHGTLLVGTDGSFAYTPAGGYAGPDSYTYTITDAVGQTSTTTVSLTVSPPPAPLAVNDGHSTGFEAPLTIAAPGVLVNDSGTRIAVTGYTVPGHGTLTIAGDGSFTYTPATGYTGPDSFTYTIADAIGQTSTATVNLTVTPPAGPVAVPDTRTTPFETPLVVPAPGVLANDTGTRIEVTGHTDPAHGTLTIGATGTFTYTPDTGYTGSDSYTYTITDGAGQTSTTTVSLTVSPPAAPVADDDSYTTPFETPLTVVPQGLMVNDSGVRIIVQDNTPVSSGTLTVNADGSLAYTPATGFSGSATFSYTIIDGAGQTDSADVTIAVAPPPAPAAVADSRTTPFETPLVVAAPGVLTNDSGTRITVTGHSDPIHGTLSIGADGSFTYTPDAGYTGPDSFSYTITDAAGQTSATTVALTVSPPAAPVAVDDDYSTPFETPFSVSGPGVVANDTGTRIAVSGNTAPAHGTVTVAADGALVYTPATGFAGSDAFQYTITDAVGQVDTATVTIVVGSPAPPIAIDDAQSTAYETPVTIAAPGVLGNDSGTRISVTDHTSPGHGSVTVTPTGGFTYTPDAGYAGTDSFDYTIEDAIGQSATATVTLTISPPAGPLAVNDAYTTPFETPRVVAAPGVLGNDAGTFLSVTGHTAPSHGTVAIAADGSLTYTPDVAFAGSDSFTYTLTDGFARSSTATVDLTVDPPAAPVATDDDASTPFETPLVVATPGVLTNDTGTRVTVTGHTDPNHGTLTIAADGSYFYLPTTGFSGTDSFDYTITDAIGQTSTATVTITVDPPAAPVATDDSDSTPFETTLSVPDPGLLVNDSGTRITVTSHTEPAHGTTSTGPDGGFAYTPDAGFTGVDTFDYMITDAAGQTASASVTITVDPPAAPVAADDADSTPFETQLDVPAPGLLDNDTGTRLVVTGSTTPAHGSATANADGSFTYTPDTGFTGTDTFDYTIADAVGQTDTATVTITVDPPAAPVAGDDARSTPFETPLVVTAPGILGNDTGTRIVVDSHTTPGHGSVTTNADGSLTYTPDTGFAGVDTFDYTIADAVGQTDTARVTVTVVPPAAPVAVDDADSTPFETPLVVSAPGLVDNDSGTRIAVTGHTDPFHGTVTTAGDGSYLYTPASTFTGTDSFDYTITDAIGRTAIATVTITVDPPAAPTAFDDSRATAYATPIDVPAPGVLTNDSGTRIAVTANTDPSHGTLLLRPDGSFLYTPAAGFAGVDSFDYTISDAVGQTDTATVTITVAPPGGPVAVADAYTTPFETPRVVAAPGVLGNDTGEAVTVSSHGTGAHGSVSLLTDGSLTYTPDAGYTGTDAFTYTITDAVGQSSSTSVTVTIDPPTAPVAVNDSTVTSFETPVTLAAPGLLGNDSGTRITVLSHTDPSHGSVTVGSNGSATYTPAAGFTGADTFTYTIADAIGQTSTATVTVTVAPPGPPVAVDDAYSTPFESPIAVLAPGLLTNDSGTAISVTGHTAAAHGTVSTGATGGLTYTPDPGFAGTDTFDYTITDGAGQTTTATVTMTVDPPAAPVAVDDSYSTPFETTLSVPDPGLLVNDSGTRVTVTSHTEPAHGTTSTGPDGGFAYTPDFGFAGTDTFDYTITDAVGQTSTATVTIDVAPPPAPAAADDTGTTPFETPLTVAAPGVLGNDSGTRIAVTTNTTPAHGSVALAGDGSYLYTPDTGFTGVDSFDYTITDAIGRTRTATVTITVEPPAAPVAVDDAHSTAYETPVTVVVPGVLGNDSGTRVTVSANTDPAHGTVTVDADGSFTYTPAAGFAGPDSFDYTITDAVGQTSSATVSLTVAPPGGPVAVDDVDSTPFETPLTVAAPGVLGNDSGTFITVTGHTDPAHGTVSIAGDGSFTYTPDTGYTGPDSFTYTLGDGFGRSSTATVNLTVDPPAAPVATDDSDSTPFETVLTVGAPGLLGNDTGTRITVTAHTDPTHGTVVVDPGGSFTYTPATGYTGTDTFDYTITDAAGQTDAATATITVSPPAAPQAVGDAHSTAYETALVVAAPGVLGNDLGTRITVTANTDPAHGSVAIAADGSFTYTPAATYAGPDAFTYTITDAVGQTSTATVLLSVSPPGGPLAVDDAHSTPFETPLTVAAPGVLGNDAGTFIAVTGNTDPSHGTVSLAADGSFTYTPATGYTGPDSFAYALTDGFGRSSSATVNLTVDPPAAPVAVPDSGSTPFETPLTVAAPGVLGNDTGTRVTVTGHTDPGHGTLSIAPDGSYLYTPDTGFTGDDSFDYTITDAAGQTSSTTVTITVDPPAAPVAVDDAHSTAYETPVTVVVPGVLGNDSGTRVTVSANTDPAHGTVTVDADGSFTYTPAAGFAGPDSFDYTITDAVGQTSSATVSLTVAPPGGPVAVDDVDSTPFETPLTVAAPGVLGNDSGTFITVTGHTDPAHGTVSIAGDGSFTYTPDTGYTGPDSFTYTLGDGFGRSSTATVNLTVDPPAAPVAADDAATTPFETTYTGVVPGVLGNDTGTRITVTANTAPGVGSVTVAADGGFSYTPITGFTGDDSFDYTITDAAGQTSTATVTITVDPPAAPVATDDGYTADFETPLGIPTPGVLGNDSGTRITVTDHTAPSQGSVTQQADGSFLYTPITGFAGDDTFDYTITDAAGQTSTATVTITVDPPAAPVATDDTATTAFETPLAVTAPGVLGNDTGTRITVTDHTDPARGTLVVNSDGSYAYTPETGFTGTDAFDYTITDAAGQTATATVTITVDPPAAPVATDDAYTTAFESALAVAVPGVLGNDTGTRITLTGNTDPAHGTLSIAADGSFTYTPDTGFTGDDTFDYTITDGAGQTAAATVTITVDPPAAPIAVDDTFSTPFESPLDLPAPGLGTNDSGTRVTVTDHTDPAHGTLVVNPDGSFTYTPDTGFTGDDTFDYTITDGAGQTATATVTITVAAPGGPVAVGDAYSTPFETDLAEPAPGVLGNDTGTRITVTAHTDPAHGTLTQQADGSLDYSPDGGFSGVDSYSYTITDGAGQTAGATVTITVVPPAAPVAADDSYSTPFETDLTVVVPGVLDNDTGTRITVTSRTDPGHGTLTLGTDGELAYTPAMGFSGDDTFTYTITDGAGQTATATVTITVVPPAAPVAVDDSYSTPFETDLTVVVPGVLGNDTGTRIVVSTNTAPGHGTVTVTADGRLTYSPAAGFSGEDTFTYTITDGAGQTDTATVTITVVPPAAPVARPDAYTTPFNMPLVVAVPGILGNDRGTRITVGHRSDTGHGALVVGPDGTMSYTPDDGFAGVDTFTYTITDAAGQTASTTVTITVEPPAGPVAVDDRYSTPFQTTLVVDVGVLVNDTGTRVTVTGHTEPAHGTLTINADGTMLYTPDKGFWGTDTFQYTITDAYDRTATATVTIDVGQQVPVDLGISPIARTGVEVLGGLLLALLLLAAGWSLATGARRRRA